MNMLEAARETVQLAYTRNYTCNNFDIEEAGYEYLQKIVEKLMLMDYTEQQKAYWLGFIHGVLMSEAVVTMSELEFILKKYMGE